MWDSTHRISTAHVSSNGNNNINNGKQLYNRNTGITWNNNTCNMNENPYDKNR